MEQMRREREKKEQRAINEDYLMEHFFKKRSYDVDKFIAEMPWPKYLLIAGGIMGFALIINFGFLNNIHFGSRLAHKRDDIMKRFRSQLEKEEIRFRANLLKKFRKEKKIEILNITDDELKSSSFFD